ncbi:MAG TPA: sugar phosphate nucleotidyltransferase [Bacteroidales bacterium]|nr:sugar phosphate nucleotidyltransferase [Bacteroidales bacterium]HSA43978.1 sugar phosphate nucleotidyltransferase [Bacteroidales bacterium]
MKPELVILAAGLGSRYGGLKQVDAVGPSGETIMEYSVYDALRAGFGKVVFVIRKNIADDFRKTFTDKLAVNVPFEFAYQELDMIPDGLVPPSGRVKPWGTGHAVMVAEDFIHAPFAVINADDYYGPEAYQSMAAFLSNEGNDTSYAMAGYALGNTLSPHGFVSRGICEADDDNKLLGITERTKIRFSEGRIIAGEGENQIPLSENAIVSMNFWGFRPFFFTRLKELFTEFMKTGKDQLTAEFYLSTAIDTLIQHGQATVEVLKTNASWFGVTYQEDRAAVINNIRNLIGQGLYPERLWH